jgi:hypothetical protein
MKIVSYSLYGNNPKYVLGAIENAKFVQSNLPDWTAVFYCGRDVDSEAVETLRKHHALVLLQDESWHRNGMFWRFNAIWDFDYSHLIFRDTDSRISLREISAVNDWEKSNELVHIIRDHPYHQTAILGGLWGIKHTARTLIPSTLEMERFGTNHGEDQYFLSQCVYPVVKEVAYVNDSFFGYQNSAHPINISRRSGEFIGESVDEFENYDLALRKLCMKVEKSFIRSKWLRLKTKLKTKHLLAK